MWDVSADVQILQHDITFLSGIHPRMNVPGAMVSHRSSSLLPTSFNSGHDFQLFLTDFSLIGLDAISPPPHQSYNSVMSSSTSSLSSSQGCLGTRHRPRYVPKNSDQNPLCGVCPTRCIHCEIWKLTALIYSHSASLKSRLKQAFRPVYLSQSPSSISSFSNS